ncbi:MAG: Chemotaxis protein CheW [Thermotoga sp. 47_83]|uniref:CheW protein n=2 Tax=Thermotoga petrophila TaxID=93929 RepID=D2C6K8_THEP2|nr:CheW protein [Thermotoga sp. RQ2]ADA66594.1 CheW protein [Thermotoga petrophila RKU-10]AGL49626.1 Positive regulator of CheA protein activity (CheW) [Thermotoga maritima MSB8]AIY85782.1 putative CheW protein [Thermotoga sp. 2812B]AIY87594.1 putative CheW protein [Thermotoga sp. Cell2]AKE26619.1 chemotaxis protein CheW [Thermotoga maritima]EJX26931.1 putative CheW protein [Thermotoga sp. EMP]KHC92523.1 putative CheW protein [Thermotoga sp. TBGT1765]KHC93494.1 putative CheW protein [Thermo
MADALKEFEVLSFEIDEQALAFDVDNIEMVIEKSDITPVPKSRHFVEGVINLRGRIIPVVNLAKILGISFDEQKMKSIIVARTKDVEVGFLVDRVLGVLRITENQLDLTNVSDKFGKKSKGLVKTDGRLIIYLDIDKIIEEITVKEGV